MISEIIMPKAGMAMETGKIIKWLVKEGDKVNIGDTILEIETDKVSMEVEAYVSGTVLKILAKEGDEVPVTQIIGYLGEPGEAIPELSSAEFSEAEKKEIPQAEIKPETKSGADYDVIVVGGGPAGYVSAIKAAQLGGKVALVEKDVVGGTCLNRGCIPTKTYLKTAEVIEHIKHSAYRGVSVAEGSMVFDMETAKANKNEVVEKLTSGVKMLLKSNGIDVFNDYGIINADRSVTLGEKTITGRAIIFCGGSKPSKVPIPGADSKYVVTSDEMLDIEQVPKRLAIIGGGVIGVELGQAFAAFGSEVTIIEMMDRITPFMDEETSAVLNTELKKSGIKILTSTRVDAIEEGETSAVLKVGEEIIEADIVLLCVGRQADLSGIEKAGVKTQKGYVIVDEMMRTNVSGIFSAGDVTGKVMLAHAAFKMGEIAAENALGGKEVFNSKHIPACIYTIPEVSGIGLTEALAKEKYDVAVGKFPFYANGRALASGESTGFVKVIADKRYGEILGVHIIGLGAAEMANEAAVMMAMEMTVQEMAKIVHAHPTYSEAIMEAAADAAGKCIHLPPEK